MPPGGSNKRPWVIGIYAAFFVHLLMGLVPLEFSQADPKKKRAVQLVIEEPAPVKNILPLPEPEPKVEEVVEPEPKKVVRKKRKNKKPLPKQEPVVKEALTPEVEEEIIVDEPIEEDLEVVEEEPVQVDLSGYGRALHSAVQHKQRYPRAARMMRMEGTVEVEMRIYPDGTLAQAPVVVKSSNHPLLDKEALRMVRVAAPFPGLPTGFVGETALFKVPVRFEIAQ